MDITDILGKDSSRPEHPDVWRLTQEIMRLDALANEKGFNARESIHNELGSYIDHDSFTYVIGERAKRLTAALEKSGFPAPIAMLVEAAIVAAWTEAFVVTSKLHDAPRNEAPEPTAVSVADGMAAVLKALQRNAADSGECTCGFGGFHEPENPNCAQNIAHGNGAA